MNTDSSMHAHPIFKLGRVKSPRDPRNLMFADFLRTPLATPRQYDFDIAHPGIPTPMFANDQYGDCVMAGRAHQTLRFELLEVGKTLSISDNDVLREYFTETGGEDSGLDPVSSLKDWQSKGWAAAGKRLFIRGFAEIKSIQHEQIRQAVYMDVGVGMGLSLPITAQSQVQAGRTWDVVLTGRDAEPGSWGGHYVHVCGYTAAGPVCVTWGRKQQMTWAFVDHYSDEVYAIFDAKDSLKTSAAIDFKKFDNSVYEVREVPT